jgi:hypothetical protein
MASSALVRLTASVASLRSADESLVALVKGLAQQIRDAVANGDSGALTALADSLDAETQTVVDAVNANSDVSTPPADVPAAQPAPVVTSVSPTDTPVDPSATFDNTPPDDTTVPAPSDAETGQPQPALGDVSAPANNDLGVEPAAQPAPDVSTDQSSGATPDAPSA